MNRLDTRMVADARRRSATAQKPPIRELAPAGPPDATLTLPPGGGAATHTLTIPAVPDMDALLVTTASLELRGVVQDAPPVTAQHATASSPLTINRPAPDNGDADLVELRIQGMSVQSGGTLDGMPLGESVPGQPVLHVLLLVRSGGAWTPPAAAAPAFDWPDTATLYPPMLAGTRVDVSARAGAVDAVITVSPPLRCSSVRVLVVRENGDLPTPTAATPVAWSAQVAATWKAVPQQATVALVDGAQSLNVATIPSLQGAFSVDLAGGLGSMLSAVHQRAPQGAPSVTLRVAAESAGRVEVRATLAAWYRKALDTTQGLTLRGSPGILRRVAPAARVPKLLAGLLHASWGPARLAASSDRDDPNARAGVALTGARRVARWVPLTGVEGRRTALRLSVFARATADAELMLALFGGDATSVGRAIGKPTAVTVVASRDPSWVRGDLPAPATLAERAGVWVVAWAPRGSVSVYARDGACMVSPDGASWDRAVGLPLTQVHVDVADDAPLPLTLRVGARVFSADVRSYGPVPPRGLRADLATVLDAAALRDATSATGVISFGFSCDQDVDLSVADLAALYDPWHPGGT